MADRTITLRSDLVERLERLAQMQGRSLEDTLDELLESRAMPSKQNWALALAVGMEAVDVAWLDEPEASSHSHELVEQRLLEMWQRAQLSGEE